MHLVLSGLEEMYRRKKVLLQLGHLNLDSRSDETQNAMIHANDTT